LFQDESAMSLSVRANTYVIAFFDCCRIPLKPIQHKGISNSEPEFNKKIEGQLYTIFAADSNSSAITIGEAENSVVTGSLLKHLRETPYRLYNFPISLDSWPEKQGRASTVDKRRMIVHLINSTVPVELVQHAERLTLDMKKVTQYSDRFHSYDGNRDGFLTKEEIIEGLKKDKPLLSLDDIFTAFCKFDTREKGQLDLLQFTDLMDGLERKLSQSASNLRASNSDEGEIVQMGRMDPAELSQKSINELKQILQERDVDYSHCIEKSELIYLVIKSNDMKTSQTSPHPKRFHYLSRKSSLFGILDHYSRETLEEAEKDYNNTSSLFATIIWDAESQVVVKSYGRQSVVDELVAYATATCRTK